jgi:hypothetical protein
MVAGRSVDCIFVGSRFEADIEYQWRIPAETFD